MFHSSLRRSPASLSAYDARIGRRFKQEFRIGGLLQKLAGIAPLFNFVVNKARKNEEIKKNLTAMYTDEKIKKRLINPGFYLRLLLG